MALSRRFFMLVSVSNRHIGFAILVAALGYFVDGYDIAIFSAVRVASLKSLGLSGSDLTTTGGFLMNVQLIGMLLGGVGWGILGDRLGRLQVLFGSILLYSLANFGNAFVQSVDQYAFCRFIGGVGLAGEIGAGITLVSELISKEKRGYGTMLVAFIGVLGFASAGFIGDLLSWSNAYIAGGCMGIALLFLRLSVVESPLFRATEMMDLTRGDLKLFLTSKERFFRYLCCVFSGAALYVYLTLFVVFAPEVGTALGIVEPLKSGKALMYACSALACGCVVASYACQILRSRKKVLYGCAIAYCGVGLYLLTAVHEAQAYYTTLAVMDFFNGSWVVLLSTVTEQFGTNLRATAATSVPNFIRGLGVVHTSLFMALKPFVGVLPAIALILVSFTLIALLSIHFLRETFGADLDFVEKD